MGIRDKILDLFRGPPMPVVPDDWSRSKSEPYQSRLVLDWDPLSIRAAITSADGGLLAPMADLWAAISRDAHVRGVMQTRTVGQVSLPHEFVGGKGKPTKLIAKHWERVCPRTEVARLVHDALGVGIGLAQLVWTEVDDVPVPTLDVWDPRWLRYDYGDPSCPRWWLQVHEHGEIEITPGDGWIVFTPYGIDHPWRGGLVNALATPWLLKQYALLDRTKHSEVNGSPAWVATANGLSESQRVKLLGDLRRMAKDARVVLPDGVALSLLESGGGSSAIYSETIAWADTEIAIAIAGQTVTSTGTDGFSEGDVFERILASLVSATASALEECLNEQLIRPWLEFWMGPRCGVPSIRYQTRPRIQLSAQAAALQSLGQGLQALNDALAEHGIRVDVERLLLEHDIPFAHIPSTDVAVGAKTLPLGPADVAPLITKNEARASLGLPPLPIGGDSPLGPPPLEPNAKGPV